MVTAKFAIVKKTKRVADKDVATNITSITLKYEPKEDMRIQSAHLRKHDVKKLVKVSDSAN